MTGQSLLNMMELLNQELQLQSGESDVTRGLLALNVAQDYFESLAAQRKGIYGSTVGTVTTSANTETTTYPTGLLRVDALYMLNSSSRPEYKMRPDKRIGGHAESADWPLNILSTPGKPTHYWTNGGLIYWGTLPDTVYTIRWYGFQSVSDITASGTFSYQDIVAFPLAAFAVKLFKSGLEDPVTDTAQIAFESFKSTLDALSNFDRDGASGLAYTQIHST